jgi:putative tryptophan/tyrosine transport system substrate-binding protein
VKRREFITLLGGVSVAWPLAAWAQQTGKVYRIGFLANDPAIPTQPAGQAFLDGLRESGFIEGKNVIIDRRFAEGRGDQYDGLIADLEQIPVEFTYNLRA